MPGTIRENLAAVRARIDSAAEGAGRDPLEVRLLLAVKTQPPARVREAIAAGATVLGHNRAQELVAMGPELAGLGHEMHFIGHLQSNKINHVLPWVTCIQTVDDAALAERLDRAARRAGRALDVFVQVNTCGEATKAGARPDDALTLAYDVGARENLRLRGFMTIGANSPDAGAVSASFTHLADLRDAVVGSGVPGTEQARELSMGMSGDLEVAIAAGSTMVRVGSAVFGPRGA
jgi:pyridoxal phosphate enzyme (YggS family)